MFRKWFNWALYPLFFGSLGCGSGSNLPGTIDPQSTRCSATTTQLLIGDGFARILCGCTGASEGDGAQVTGSQPLICHVPSVNSKVFVIYSGNYLRHQIVSTGAHSFTSSPVNDPNNGNSVRSHVITFSEPSATYLFKDFYSGLTGQLIVP